MVTIHLSGGFGNQLHSYAFGYAMAKKRLDVLAIDTAIQDAPWFFRNPDILNLNIKFDKRITYPIGRNIWDRALLNRICYHNAVGWGTIKVQEDEKKGNLQGYYEKTQKYKNIYLKGNWDSVKYFADEVDDIKKMYTFNKPLGTEAGRISEEISGTPSSVTLHYRRGDYVKLGACIKPDYFVRAMQYMGNYLEHPTFFCFSEDLEWVKKQFCGLPFRIRYVEYNSNEKGLEDFRLLQEGQHQIISNSSYSWWAAFLNKHENKIVIAPFALNGNIWGKEFCLKEWIGMPFEMLRGEKC